MKGPWLSRDVYNDWTSAPRISQRICKAHIFDEAFGINRAFNTKVFVTPPHAVAMEFDLFGERRSDWVKGSLDRV